ncbi:MAG: ABC transporter permease [Chloroflexi bacterium]|nr:ABC transporter permease [Chloroflexota bacterium]
MFKRIWAVIQKEFIQTLRDRRTLGIQLALPMIQLVLFGYAITTQVSHIPTIVADQSLDAASRAFLQALTGSGYFDVIGSAASLAEVSRAIDAGRAQVGVVIPPDFAARVNQNDAAALILVDGSDLFTSQSAYNAATVISQAHSVEITLERLRRSGQVRGGQSFLPLDTRLRILYNPDLKDLWFLIPGMVALLLQMQTVILTAAAVVREREAGTIEQLLVTPIRPIELMIGKIAPNMAIALVNMLTILGLGILWFRVPFRGDFWLFFGLALLYMFAGLGLGLLVSTVSQNQRQVQQINGMIIILGLLLSGFIFPRSAMPQLPRVVGNLFPLTYFIPISRGIITKGVGIESLRGEVAALTAYVVIIMLLATRAFRRRLD